MHAVIPTADERNNPTLSYALDSIRLHTDHTPVTIGKDWGLCEHIPTVQHRTNIFANTDLAMKVACETDWISDPFIWTADDCSWRYPAEPIRWALGKLEDAHGSTDYQKRKRKTANLLHSLGLPTFDYEAHVPMLVNKAIMLEALDLDGDKRSVYGNLTGQPDLIAADVKIRRITDPFPDAPWISIEATSRRPELLTYLEVSRR